MKTWCDDKEIFRRGRVGYVIDDQAFPADAYTTRDYPGIAWRVFGWETEPDEETEWTGLEQKTGKIVCVMVGDDRPFLYDPEDVTPLEREEYCGVCGQIGCGHDGLDRSED